jgi:NADH:ubiquinone oxidoreductase subunit 6 (subunit J)
MKSTVIVIRAIGAEFARRIVFPVIVIGALITVALLTLGGWLTTQNAWWWVIEALFILYALIFVAVTVVVLVIIRTLAPTLSKTQKQSVKNFVDKLGAVAEHLQTPQLVIIFNIVRDMLRPNRHGFIESVSTETKSLAPDFAKLRKDFE